MNHVTFLGRALALAACALSLAGTGFAQEARATLSGTITDPSGSSVAGAQVRITNTETGIAGATAGWRADGSCRATSPGCPAFP